MNDILQSLNNEQKKAVQTDKDKVLILAGAGTGKTNVITSRIKFLIKNKNISPFNILAVTFTNKAANEMKDRVCSYFKSDLDIMIKTFHSFGAYILRNNAFAAFRNNYFQIYDAEDSSRLIKNIIVKKGLNKSSSLVYYKKIQRYKQNMEVIDDYNEFNDDFFEIYEEYESNLKSSNCFDFEDLILQPIKIFRQHHKILEMYQKRFKYILVDEYQDTNKTQFELLKIFKIPDNNIIAVGDEDQSIYKFRGADVKNILNFQNDFSDSEIIKLEENYRSTNNILNAANHVIENNKFRIGKNLYSNKEQGSKIYYFKAFNETDEVEKVLYLIDNEGLIYEDTAILIRTNNQTRSFEQVFNRRKIPYLILGSIAFFEREEIKDAISLLKWIVNPRDKISFSRFINKPSRGIGDRTLDIIFNESSVFDNDIMKVLKNIDSINTISEKNRMKFSFITDVLKDLDVLRFEYIDSMLEHMLNRLGIIGHYKTIDEKDGSDRGNNILELIKSLCGRKNTENDIASYLEEVTLAPSDKNTGNVKKSIKILTAHNSKGLEFENVFICGMEEGLFPSIKFNYDADNTDELVEEERRLFYVAMTRAEKRLCISYAASRIQYNIKLDQKPSRFIRELPDELIEAKFINYEGYGNDDAVQFEEGELVEHKDYGKGRIVSIKRSGRGKALALIDFYDHSYKELFLDVSGIKKILKDD